VSLLPFNMKVVVGSCDRPVDTRKAEAARAKRSFMNRKYENISLR